MKYLKVLLIFIVVFYLYNCTDKEDNTGKSETAREELLAAIAKFNEAFKTCNLTVLKAMITDNYLHTNGNLKSIGKADWLGYLEKRKKAVESGNLEVLTYNMDETAVALYGNMAIVTARISAAGRMQDSIQNNEYRVTHVWIKESGMWKRAAFHDGNIR